MNLSTKNNEQNRQVVMPGAEAFHFPAGDTGCLLIHGISGSPQVFRAIGEKLAAAGFSAYGVRLRGHGTRIEDMHKCTYSDWVDSSVEGLELLEKSCSRVIVVGLSMGGVLSMRLARLYPEKVKGVVSICSPYKLRAFRFKFVPFLKPVLKVIPGGPPSINDPEAVEINYGCHSVPAVHQLIKLTALVRKDLPHIRQPALIMGGRHDTVVDPRDPVLYYEQIGSEQKELFWLENSQHVAPLDYEREIILEKIIQFTHAVKSV
jgi:carboxylesterase